MNKPDWNDAPKWAKWLSQDRDASWWWHQYKPKWHEDYGWWQGIGKQEEVVVPVIVCPNAAKTLESKK